LPQVLVPNLINYQLYHSLIKTFIDCMLSIFIIWRLIWRPRKNWKLIYSLFLLICACHQSLTLS